MGEEIAPTIVGLEKVIRDQKKKFDRALMTLEVNINDKLSLTNEKIDDNLKSVLRNIQGVERKASKKDANETPGKKSSNLNIMSPISQDLS